MVAPRSSSLARPVGAMVLLLFATASAGDVRPTLPLVASRTTSGQQVALQRVKDSARAVKEAVRVAEAAKQQLQQARSAARAAREDLERERELAAAEARPASIDRKLAEHKRALSRGRATVLGCLFAYTFLNGLARRSLSSAGPSMVAEGLITEKRADEIFSVGFEAFAVGKFLVVASTIVLGVRRSLLLQLLMMTLSCAAYLVAPGSAAVQLGGWVLFRIFSAMAVSTMLPFVVCRLWT